MNIYLLFPNLVFLLVFLVLNKLTFEFANSRAETPAVAADWAANIAAVVRETFSEAALLAGKSLGCGVGKLFRQK